MRYAILIFLCPWFSWEEFREVLIEINKILRIFASLQFVLIDNGNIQYIYKQDQNGNYSLFSAMKVSPNLSIHASTSRLKSKKLKRVFSKTSDTSIPKLWLSLMLAFIPCPKRRFSTHQTISTNTHRLSGTGYDMHLRRWRGVLQLRISKLLFVRLISLDINRRRWSDWSDVLV